MKGATSKCDSGRRIVGSTGRLTRNQNFYPGGRNI